jgi:hypothetical protein
VDGEQAVAGFAGDQIVQRLGLRGGRGDLDRRSCREIDRGWLVNIF